MRVRSDTLSSLGAALAIVALIAGGELLSEGARSACARLEREREQLTALALLQSRIDVSRDPDLGRLLEVRGLFGDATLQWSRRDGCAFLTFGELERSAGAAVLAVEVAR